MQASLQVFLLILLRHQDAPFQLRLYIEVPALFPLHLLSELWYIYWVMAWSSLLPLLAYASWSKFAYLKFGLSTLMSGNGILLWHGREQKIIHLFLNVIFLTMAFIFILIFIIADTFIHDNIPPFNNLFFYCLIYNIKLSKKGDKL